MPINELRSITIFVKIAELGSLRKAAEAQNMTPQAASQALAQLEQHLGVRLFHRTTRSMALTDAGRQFLDTALPALEHQVLPSLCVNDEELETHAVLAGHAIGQLTAIAAASHIRSGRLVPLLTEHVVEPASAFIYYGSRAAQPLRMRAFIDLAVKRLAGNRELLLAAEELAAAGVLAAPAQGLTLPGDDRP